MNTVNIIYSYKKCAKMFNNAVFSPQIQRGNPVTHMYYVLLFLHSITYK